MQASCRDFRQVRQRGTRLHFSVALLDLLRALCTVRACLEVGFNSEKSQFFDETRRLFEERTVRYSRKKQRSVIKKMAFAAQRLASKQALSLYQGAVTGKAFFQLPCLKRNFHLNVLNFVYLKGKHF